jgi:hypothetical protein
MTPLLPVANRSPVMFQSASGSATRSFFCAVKPLLKRVPSFLAALATLG